MRDVNLRVCKVSRDRASGIVAHLQKAGGDHLIPIINAVSRHKCAHVIVSQGAPAFRCPDDRPIIALIGDDMHSAKGPEAFPRRSMRRMVAKCRTAVIVSSGAELTAYATAAAKAAQLRQHVVLIETRPEREIEWIAFVQAARPDISLVLCQPRPAGGVH